MNVINETSNLHHDVLDFFKTNAGQQDGIPRPVNPSDIVLHGFENSVAIEATAFWKIWTATFPANKQDCPSWNGEIGTNGMTSLALAASRLGAHEVATKLLRFRENHQGVVFLTQGNEKWSPSSMLRKPPFEIGKSPDTMDKNQVFAEVLEYFTTSR